MASVIASLVSFPRHSSMIASQSMPLAIWSSTSAINMHVPRKVGSPWQLSGLTTIHRPNDFISIEINSFFLYQKRFFLRWSPALCPCSWSWAGYNFSACALRTDRWFSCNERPPWIFTSYFKKAIKQIFLWVYLPHRICWEPCITVRTSIWSGFI